MAKTVEPEPYTLVCMADDKDDPSEVTISDPHEDADLSACWVTVDADHAIPEEEWA